MSAPVFPAWLQTISLASIGIALLCAAIILVDEVRRPQPMWIMNLVWPLTALFGSVLWLAFYWRWGRGQLTTGPVKHHGAVSAPKTSMIIAVAKGTSHCGAGCTLGDLLAETLAMMAPAVAIPFGWRWLFLDKMFAVWGLDFVLAFLLGVAFQYFTLKPMRDLSVLEALLQSIEADAASIFAWQVGMFGFMAFAQFIWFTNGYGGMAQPNAPEFWLAMQIAMLFGFATSYPVNWVLVRAGIKERM